MIWLWLWRGWRLTLRLILPPPPAARQHYVIDENAACPGCGHCNGKIRCTIDRVKQMQSVIRHDCSVCGAHWFEETVVKGNANVLLPSEIHVG